MMHTIAFFALTLSASLCQGSLTWMASSGEFGWRSIDSESNFTGGAGFQGARPLNTSFVSDHTIQRESTVSLVSNESFLTFNQDSNRVTFSGITRVAPGVHINGDPPISFSYAQVAGEFIVASPLTVTFRGDGTSTSGGFATGAAFFLTQNNVQLLQWSNLGNPNHPRNFDESVLLSPGSYSIGFTVGATAMASEEVQADAIATLNLEITFIPSPSALTLWGVLLAWPKRRR